MGHEQFSSRLSSVCTFYSYIIYYYISQADTLYEQMLRFGGLSVSVCGGRRIKLPEY